MAFGQRPAGATGRHAVRQVPGVRTTAYGEPGRDRNDLPDPRVGGKARMTPATPSAISPDPDLAAMSLPLDFHRSSDERLQDALRSYSGELGALEGLIVGKLDLLKCYD